MTDWLQIVVGVVAVLLSLGGTAAAVETAKALRRSKAQALDVGQQVADYFRSDYEKQFPEWRSYVLDKLPSDQWPEPAVIGCNPQPATQRPHDHEWITLYRHGEAGYQRCQTCGVRRQPEPVGYITAGTLALSPGEALLMKAAWTLAQERPQLAGKVSPQGHSLQQCLCDPCQQLRKERFGFRHV